MKRIIIPILLLAVSVFSTATTLSEITDVTVYQRGARITNEVLLDLKPGTNELVISDITTSIDANSIQVKLFGDAILLSATTRVRQKEDTELPKRSKALNDSLLIVSNEIKWLKSEKGVYEGEKQLIIANQQLNTSEEKATVEEIIRLSNFYRERLLEINKKAHRIDGKVYDLEQQKKMLQAKLQALRYQERVNVGEVLLKVSAKASTKIKAKISYLSYQAGWSPIYDVRAGSSDEPVDLVYKANVYQTTGYSWEGVNLSISTGNPSIDNNRPTMYPWYINFDQPVSYKMAAEMNKKEMSASNALQRTMMADEMELDEVVVGYVESKGYDVVQTENTIATEYAIKIAQDIPSDGKQHLVAIQEYELNTKFSHHAIPKLNKSTFLIAKVADYGNYNLLAGQANLFFEGMYIGQSYLNPVTTTDSLLLSLGRDEKVIVKRNQLKDLTNRQSIGSNTRETRTYEITVRNNNSYDISIDLMDQLPLSNNKEIVVEIDEIGGAKYDSEYGSLLWKLPVRSGESTTVRFSYSVKYPKDKMVSGL